MATDPIPPLDVIPGLWVVKRTLYTSGPAPIPPELRAKLTPQQLARVESQAREKPAPGATTVTKTCLDRKALNQQILAVVTDRQGCKQEVTKASPTRQDIRLECSEGTVKSNATITVGVLDQLHFSVASVWLTTDGGREVRVVVSVLSKWLGPNCPATLMENSSLPAPDSTARRKPPDTAPLKTTPNPAGEEWAYYDRQARDQIAQKNFHGAVGMATKGISLDARQARPYNTRGYAYLRLGDFSAAIADFSEAIRLRPDYANAYQNRASARRRLGDEQNAAADSQRAAELGNEKSAAGHSPKAAELANQP